MLSLSIRPIRRRALAVIALRAEPLSPARTRTWGAFPGGCPQPSPQILGITRPFAGFARTTGERGAFGRLHGVRPVSGGRPGRRQAAAGKGLMGATFASRSPTLTAENSAPRRLPCELRAATRHATGSTGTGDGGDDHESCTCRQHQRSGARARSRAGRDGPRGVGELSDWGGRGRARARTLARWRERHATAGRSRPIV